MQCFREEIENITTASQETILFKGDTVELPNELENIEDSISDVQEFGNTLIGEIDNEWTTVENAFRWDGNGEATIGSNILSPIQTVDFASTCMQNSDILVSNGEVEDLLTMQGEENADDICNYIPQVEPVFVVMIMQ